MTVGDRIKKRRESIGMSQTELAQAAKTSKQNIYKYENGIITNIPSDRIEMIACCLGVSPAYLMGWTENEDISHYDHLISTYLRGILIWSEDKLAKPHDTEVYRMHFAELLLRYKQLIERAVYASLSVDEYLESVEEFNASRNLPMTTEQLKEQYFKAELQKELDSLTHWINAFPFYLSRSEESSDTK